MCYCQPSVRTPFCNNCAPKMFQDIKQLKEQRDELIEALGSIAEYWNQDQNHDAMADACWYAINTAQDAIAKATSK